MIKSPYNFVPAPSEDEVFIPHWADQVSQRTRFYAYMIDNIDKNKPIGS